jgi:hypothetical protein
MAYETYTPMFSEIAKRVHNAKDKPTKIKVLNKYRSPAWEMFLKSALDPRIEWMLPEGGVPYIENEAPEGEGDQMRLATEMNKMYNFVQMNREDIGKDTVVGNPGLSRLKREQMFIQMLEGLHKEEAELILLAKDKNIHRKYKGLNTPTVTAAYGWSETFEPM